MAYRIPNTEIFLVDYTEHSSICYSPLKEEICLIDAEAAEQLRTLPPRLYTPELREFIADTDAKCPEGEGHDISRTTKLSIIPNSICNLACSYCYSAAGRSSLRLSREQAEAALRWYVDPMRIDGDFVSIFITGGGEPLATWDVTSYIISRARELGVERGVRMQISIITNGTLLTDEIIGFLREHECSVGVSFDVIEDVQNANRGKYALVKQNVKRLLSAGLRVMINSTIIPGSVGRLTEAVREVIGEYPTVAQYTMEPATGTALFDSPEGMREFYDTFLTEYFRAKEIARDAELNLRFTFDDALRGVTTRHCPGKFAVTPGGSISVCHLVSSPLEERYGECTYGTITDQGVTIDTRRFGELYARNLFAYPECADCVAKWSCGGECFTRRSTYTPEYMAEVCRFNRNVIEHMLREEVKDVEIS